MIIQNYDEENIASVRKMLRQEQEKCNENKRKHNADKRKHDVKNIHLQIVDFETFVNDDDEYRGITISWLSDIGFGIYTIYQSTSGDDDKWYADSETMDSNEDKEFISELMRLFIEELYID